MKLSIAWIFSHINADWKKVNLNELIKKFNTTTAEIESFKKISIDLSKLFIAQVINVETENVILFCKEINKEIELPKRDNIKLGQNFLIKKENEHKFSWSRASDLGSEKDSLLPSIFIEENLIAGQWKKDFEAEDYVIEVDNKSITHRPDMWGHRGFAREIAAILNLNLIDLEKCLDNKIVLNFDSEFNVVNENNFSTSINNAKKNNNQYCKRFAIYYIDKIQNKSSMLNVIARLSKIDSKSINSIVDATNYVMFDLGQPMHAFDADKISGKKIFPRFAFEKEKLTLLDGDSIDLSNEDLIISDENSPIALAGIMGGKNSEVTESTKSILIEAACFDATIVRLSSIRHKKRTEASARFEKSLDPNLNVIAIERFLNILGKSKINYESSNDIISLGCPSNEITINVSQDFIDKKIGTEIDSQFIVDTLKKLEFKVNENFIDSFKTYNVTIPTFRSSKDIHIPEDIVEEIGRFFGYNNIPLKLPLKQMLPNDISAVMKIRKIKELMAFSLHMHEVQNYPFFDESFLNELHWHPKSFISVISPVSENWKSLVNSLIPHLIKDVKQNLGKSDTMNFFELNNVWEFDKEVKENKILAGIFFDSNKIVDFYESKLKIDQIFNLLKIRINWVKSDIYTKFPWYDKNQTANLIVEEHLIGHAGKISKDFFNKLVPGDAFIFEINSDFLINYNAETVKFKPLLKFPSVWLDISMFVTLDKTVEQIIKIINSSNSKIYKVDLIDYFEKADWTNKKSLTFRYYFADENKTLTKDEIDQIANAVINNIQKIGAQLR